MKACNRFGLWIPMLVLLGCSDTEEGDQSRIVAQQPQESAIVQQIDGGTLSVGPKDPSAVASTAFAKVVVVDMRVAAEGLVTLTNPRVLYGEAPNHIGNPAMLTAQLVDVQGVSLVSIPLWDPRWTLVWSDEEDRDFVDIEESAETTIILPFNREVAKLSVFKDKERIASSDLSQAVAEFCEKTPDDPDCYLDQTQVLDSAQKVQ